MATIMIKEAYVSFEIAKLLKEKGFNILLDSKNWLCCMYDKNGNIKWGCYDENWYFRTTHQMAIAWFRQKYNISIEPSALNAHSWAYTIYKLLNNNVKELHNDGVYESYEEAVEAALKYCLTNLI